MREFNKKVLDKIKLYSNQKYLDGYIRNEFLTEDGTAEIFININDKEDMFDSYTMANQLDLKNEIYEFVEEKTSMLGNSIPIRLNISGYKFTTYEQEAIRHIYKEHFAIELYKVQLEYKKNRNKLIFLISLGIIAFIFYILFSLVFDFEFILIVFSFLASFSLWEAMDSLIYNMSEIKYNRAAVTQNLLATIEFNSK